MKNESFYLIVVKTGKKYRMKYANTIDEKKREQWRKEWKAGKIRFECGCGSKFGINARGAIYYPAGCEKQRHQRHCIKYRPESEKVENSTLILSDIPHHPKESGKYRSDWLSLCGEHVKELKQTNGSSIFKILKLNCIEANEVKSLKQYMKNLKELDENERCFLVSKIQAIQEYPYGFVKLTVLDASQTNHSIWLSKTFIHELPHALEIGQVFIGFCFLRIEKWKQTTYRKIYVLEGVVASSF